MLNGFSGKEKFLKNCFFDCLCYNLIFLLPAFKSSVTVKLEAAETLKREKRYD